MAVVDPGVGTARNIIVAAFDGHIFLAPDNGLLPVALGSSHDAKIYRMDDAWLSQQSWPQPSHTFHGRDIFAPLAAGMASKRFQPADIGPAVTDIVPSLLEPPIVESGKIRGSVVTIDHFGNLITDIDATLLSGYQNPKVHVGGQRLPVHTTYGNARPGEFLALINSFDVVEVARAEGNAAEGLGLGRGAPVMVKDG